MAQWEIEKPLNYNLNGETADTFLYKTKATFDQIFELLNILRSAGAQAGLDATDAAPYQIRINTADNCLYMRNATNEQWIYIGEIKANLGITPGTINAIENGGNIGKISGGLDANKPRTGNNTNDLYLATDSNTLYRWTGNAWVESLSLDFSKLKDYEKYCVNRNEVATSGKGKILKLDEVTGKANVDITGSPERLLGYEIDVRNLKGNDVLAFNEQKQKIVNLPKDEVTFDDTSYTGEANKLIRVAGDGKAHVSITGNAESINGLKIEAAGAQNGQVLSYENGRLVFVDQDNISEDDITTTGEAGKLVKVGTDGWIRGKVTLPDESVTTSGVAGKIVKVANDGNIYGKFNGSTTQIGDIKLQIINPKDGDVFVYHQATKTIKNEPKGAVGAGSNLILKDGNRLLGEYNGSSPVTVDVANVIAHSQTAYVNHLLRLVENLYLALEVAGLNPGGYDGAVWSAYSPVNSETTAIDSTNVLVTSIVKGDDSIDVDQINLLTTGENYRLVEGDHIEDVQVKYIKPVYGIKRVIFTEPVKYQFTPNVARLMRSNVSTNTDGTISGDDIIILSKPIEFNAARSKAHLIVKHQVNKKPVINAEIAFRNSYLEAENFKSMVKTCFYLDQENTARGTTEFIFATSSCSCGGANCTCGAGGGMIATIRIKATGSPVTIDSFAAVFNE